MEKEMKRKERKERKVRQKVIEDTEGEENKGNMK